MRELNVKSSVLNVSRPEWQTAAMERVTTRSRLTPHFPPSPQPTRWFCSARMEERRLERNPETEANSGPAQAVLQSCKGVAPSVMHIFTHKRRESQTMSALSPLLQEEKYMNLNDTFKSRASVSVRAPSRWLLLYNKLMWHLLVRDAALLSLQPVVPLSICAIAAVCWILTLF